MESRHGTIPIAEIFAVGTRTFQGTGETFHITAIIDR